MPGPLGGGMRKRSEGFAILKPTDRVIRDYLATRGAIEHRPFINDLWARIHPHDPHSYRGIGCIVEGISPAPDTDQAGWLATLNIDPHDPLLATRLAIGRYF